MIKNESEEDGKIAARQYIITDEEMSNATNKQRGDTNANTTNIVDITNKETVKEIDSAYKNVKPIRNANKEIYPRTHPVIGMPRTEM